jgi:hypothetical protein
MEPEPDTDRCGNSTVYQGLTDEERLARAECDICGQPATVVRPAIARTGRELALYCDFDAKRSLGWGDTFHQFSTG